MRDMEKKELSETEEDYLRTIYELTTEKGYATVSDIASKLGVRAPSVTDMMKKMSMEGYVVYRAYKPIILTKKGKKAAEDISNKHIVLRDFLRIIGIDDETAEEDACGIEHHLHKETINRLTKFVEFVEKAPRYPRWLEHFEEYLKTGKLPEECPENEKEKC